MFIKVAMTKGKKGRRLTTCRPTDQRSVSLLSDFYPDANWLEAQPFDTGEFTLFISDAPLGDEAAIQIPPVPYIEPKGGYTHFEIQNSKGIRIGTSMQHPVTQLTLLSSELDPDIITEQRAIYLGVGPAEKPEEVVVIDPPEAIGVDTTVVVCPPDETTPEEADPPAIDTDYIETAMNDHKLAEKYLKFFLQHHIKFCKGSRLTSKMLHAAIVDSAPDDVRADLLSRREILATFRQTFGTGMEKRSGRVNGKLDKYWKDVKIHIHRPDPLERTWL